MVKMVKLLGKYSIFALLCWTLLISLKDDFFANEVMKNPVKQFYNDSSEKEYTYKGFTYVINNDDTISIKKYTGKSKKVLSNIQMCHDDFILINDIAKQKRIKTPRHQ